jgi:DNA-binding NtrC family response regulator
LRERPDDLPLLVEHSRRRFNERYGLTIDGVTPAAVRELAAHTWPGNVRELEAVLREAMIFKEQGRLEAEDLVRAGC